MAALTILYHVTLSLAVFGLLLLFRRRPTWRRFFLLTGIGFFTALFLAFLIGDRFDLFWTPVREKMVLLPLRSNLRLFDQGIFIEGVLFLLVSGLLMGRSPSPNKGEGDKTGDEPEEKERRKRGRKRRVLLYLTTFGIALIGIDAHFIEPYSPVVRHLEIRSEKLDSPIRIVLMTDLQTDRFGPYEDRIIRLIKEQNADLILLGGDYYQFSRRAVLRENSPFHYGPENYGRTVDLRAEVRKFWEKSHLSAPLGVFAVGGTSLREPFEEDNFKGTGIHYFKKTTTFRLRPDLRLTGLDNVKTWLDPQTVHLALEKAERGESPSPFAKDGEKSGKEDGKTSPFTILIGHCPSYLFAYPDADLLLAGHTHGGQIQIPGVGPILTMTRGLPRRLASGHHAITPKDLAGYKYPFPKDKDEPPILPPDDWSADLVVSNGVGLEREWAPPVRLFCRPDLWVIDLSPISPKAP